EHVCLGSALISPRQFFGECIERLDVHHFHIPAHATIYEVLIELWNDSEPIDFITLTQILTNRRQLDQVGGPAFVTDLFTFVPTAANVSYYLDIVREKRILRQIIASCTECVARAYDNQDAVENLVDEVERKIFA